MRHQAQPDLSVNDSSTRTASRANKSREVTATNKNVCLRVCYLTISNHLDNQIQDSLHELQNIPTLYARMWVRNLVSLPTGIQRDSRF